MEGEYKMRSEALKRAQARYQEKVKRVEVKFTANDISLYNDLKEKAEQEGISIQAFIKKSLENAT